jgi:hypothetical protein
VSDQPWNPNRRWDPVIWQDAGRWHMICLSSDYSQPGNAKPWFNEDNALERWSGETLETLQLEVTARRTGRVWTAASVFQWHRGHLIGLAGWNDHQPHMNQRIEYLCPYSLEVERGHSPPAPPLHLAHCGATSWRDATITEWDGRFLMAVTTGGFRWGSTPNVWGYLSDSPRGPWEEYGPLVDPALAVLFAELERPQLHRLRDGRWAMIASCWPQRQFIAEDAPPIHVLISDFEMPIFRRHLAMLDGPYGAQLMHNHWVGWKWVDVDSFTSECMIIPAKSDIDTLIATLIEQRMEEAA